MSDGEYYNYKERLESEVKEAILTNYGRKLNIVVVWVQTASPGSFGPVAPHGYVAISLFFRYEFDKDNFFKKNENINFENFARHTLHIQDEENMFTEKVTIKFIYDTDERVRREDNGNYFKGMR